jgi:hypothetical protein
VIAVRIASPRKINSASRSRRACVDQTSPTIASEAPMITIAISTPM